MTNFTDHEPCIICRGLGARFSECLSELGRAKGSRTQCRSITERERERRRNGREVSGHIDGEVLQLQRDWVEILARFVTCF